MISFKPMTTQEEWFWFKERTHVIFCEDSQGIVAFDRRGVQAVCVFDSFSVDACNVHFAIDNPFVIRAGFFTAVADHAYETCKRTRMFGLVPDNNQKAFDIDKKIGFTEIARVPHALSEGVGYIVMSLHKDDCRWRSALMHKEAA